MRKLNSSRKPSSKPATVAASVAPEAAPVETVAAPEAPISEAPVSDTSAPVELSAAPADATPANVAKPSDDATVYRSATRDAAGVVRFATNFDTVSSRDDAYLRFFGAVMRANGGSATLKQIHESGVRRAGEKAVKRYNPFYDGSAKATDVGAINRGIKAGYYRASPDGLTLTATPKAVASSHYNFVKLEAPKAE